MASLVSRRLIERFFHPFETQAERSGLRRIRAAGLAIAALFVLFVSTAHAQPAAGGLDPKLIEALAKQGLAKAQLVAFALKREEKTEIKAGANEVSQGLDRLARGYKKANEASRLGVGLLDTTLDVALVGIDVGTGGSSIVVTSGARWVKKQAMSELYEHLKNDHLRRFKADLGRLEKTSGLTYDQLAKSPPAVIHKALDQIGYFAAMERDLAGDSEAQQIARESAVRALVASNKATLDQVADTQTNVRSLAKGLANYARDTQRSLNRLEAQIAATDAAVAGARQAVDDLLVQTADNTAQLRAISDLMYGKSTPAERVLMLRSGYLKGVIDEDKRQKLQTAAEAEAKRAELMSQMNAVVVGFSQIGQIADNLGIDSPELNTAITVATTANSVISNIVEGNFLGAIVGLTGLFSSRPDPAAERHAQLMSFLQKQFDQVNTKLDALIEGQQKLMEGIGLLAEQMAEHDARLNLRLDRVEYSLDRIESQVRQLLYLPLAQCGVVRENILKDFQRAGLPLSDPLRLDQIAAAARSAFFQLEVLPCLNYLQTLFRVGLDPDAFDVGVRFEPLALRLASTVRRAPNAVPDDVKAQVVTDGLRQKFGTMTKAEQLYNLQYLPTWDVVSQAMRVESMPLSVGMAALSNPTGTVTDYSRKVEQYRGMKDVCASDTLFSEPLVALLCRVPNDLVAPSLLTLGIRSPQREQVASPRAENLMRMALMYDSLATLADWSLFFAPLYDVGDTNTQSWVTDPELMLLSDSVQLRGDRLIAGALQAVVVGLAQSNLLYGDVTAATVFNQLWDSSEKAFVKDAAALSDQQKHALALLNSKNDYLLKNVLMFGLRTAAGSTGELALAYRQALDYMQDATVNPDSQLRTLFGDSWRFERRLVPAKAVESLEQFTEVQKQCEDGSAKEGECVDEAVAVILGLKIPLPSADSFADGELIYPPVVSRLLQSRAKLATRLADYQVFAWVEKEGGKDARDAAIRALIVANR